VPATGEAESAARVVRDSFGNELIDGDSAVVIKDLKVKKSSLVVELGAKVRRIGLVDRDQYFNCRTEGIGAMGLNSEFVKHA
jgi:protein PhnA